MATTSKNPATSASSGSPAWSSHANATGAANGTLATAQASNQTTGNLVLTNFAFPVPLGSTPTGYTVTLTCKADNAA